MTDVAGRAGITVGRDGPCDIRVIDERFYDRVARDGSLGLGESYMQGWWETPDLAALHERIAAARLGDRHESGRFTLLLRVLRARLVNLQSRPRAPIVAHEHYDRTDHAYRCMTDSWVTLSCGYWRTASDLQAAQEAKLDLVCRKLGLKSGDHVLDVGCGFGSFARFAATRYGCRVTGINVSSRQVEVATGLAKGLPVEFVLCDYRDLPARFGEGHFDHAASMGMFEHVGHRNLATYMRAVRSVLKPGGLFLLHTVGSDVTVRHNDLDQLKQVLAGDGQVGNCLRQILRSGTLSFARRCATACICYGSNSTLRTRKRCWTVEERLLDRGLEVQRVVGRRLVDAVPHQADHLRLAVPVARHDRRAVALDRGIDADDYRQVLVLRHRRRGWLHAAIPRRHVDESSSRS